MPTSAEDLQAAIEHVRAAPPDGGVVELIVRRPTIGERELLELGRLSTEDGLVGDTWNVRASRRTDGGGPHPDMQLNLINARFSALLGGSDDERALAGDQLHVDLDLSGANLPPGTRLALGSAVIEVTDQPHTGCVKFSQRFGPAALRFVNSPIGRELNLRGINARVIQPGTVTRGDPIAKV